MVDHYQVFQTSFPLMYFPIFLYVNQLALFCHWELLRWLVCTSRDRHTKADRCNTNIFLREVTGSSDTLIVDMDLQLLDHMRQPIRHGPQQGVHVGHVWTK